MKVLSISLENFRNYAREEALFDPGINVITGQNAQGKTNLLEAVYLLAGGRSFRTRFDRELISHGAEFARIDARFEAADRRQEMQILLRRGLCRKVTLNGAAKRSSSELSESLRAVLFCPEDLNLVRDGPAVRRRFLDMAICQLRPNYALLLAEYSKLYEHKTRILRDYREKPSLLDTLEDFSTKLCLCSARMIRYRAAFVQKLFGEALPIHREFSNNAEALGLSYSTMSTVSNPLGPLPELLEGVLAHQEAHREAELRSGLCLTGAHKDDLEVLLDGLSARSFASQGQTRTAALSLKLAERELLKNELGEYPVLLLDDVLSELDRRRREFVLGRIGGGQTIITCCEEDGLAQKTGGRVITVSGGQIAK